MTAAPPKGCHLMTVAVVVVLCVTLKDNVSATGSYHCPEGDSACGATERDDEELHVVALHISDPVSRPEAMSMMAEDPDDAPFRPTPLPLTTLNTSNTTILEEPRGRALNLTTDLYHDSNNLSLSKSSREMDLSDVTIRDGEDDDMMEEELRPKILVPVKNEGIKNAHNVSTGFCLQGGLTYENGEKLELGCDSVCTCSNGKMNCADRCTGSFFKKGKHIEDPLCVEKGVADPCCAVMVCAGDTETEPLEMCTYGNKTFNRGDIFKKDCAEVCICEAAGRLSCKPRCPLPKKTSESCVEIPDPSDPCCKKILCDVTLDDHQEHEKDEAPKPNKHKITSATQPNSTIILLDISPQYSEDEDILPIVEVSNDKEEWDYYQLFPKGKLFVKETFKYVRLEGTEDIVDVRGNDNGEERREVVDNDNDNKDCEYKGKKLKSGEEYSDGCESLCMCHKGEMKCLKLECPTYFGVDVLDPGCIEWETIPPNFNPSPPNCCPEQVRCKHNGSCVHEGQNYKNWEQLPVNVTGCEKRCYCEMGNVECQNACPPVPALPPPDLACPPKEASLQHAPDDDCCMYWVCSDRKTEAAGPSTKPPLDKGQTFINKTKPNFLPTKILGPLQVYENSANSEDNQIDPLGAPHVPHLPPQENPFTRPTDVKKNQTGLIMPSGNLPELPLHPAFHSPEDLLQFVQQHPELSNLPSGSVLEIHSIPSKLPTGPAGPGHHDLSLEQILEELHKNVHPQNPLLPSLHNRTFIGHAAGGVKNKTLLPGGFNNFGFTQPQEDISVQSLEAVDAHTVRLAFMVPSVIVGLHGRVEVRYTYKESDEDLNSWDLQVFAPPNDLIATSSLEFDLLDLVPDKAYKIKITITLRDLHNTPSSRVYKIRTPKEVQSSTLPPRIPIEPQLEISDINSTWVTVAWRRFTEYEVQFIDGVQLRYRELDGKIYTATPLIHRAVTMYTIENLKPNTKYEIGIFFIPFAGQHTELHAEHMAQFTTANLLDTYGFSVSLDVSLIKSTSVEISWTGVPYPEDKYVNIYRAIYQSDSGKEDQSTFKIAKRDSPTRTIITDLKPGTHYRLWLEIYLTNGKIKTSNVQDFITKPRAAPALGSSSQDKISRADFAESGRGDYYGPLVIVAILATIAILSSLILLLILVRRHNQNKAAITPPSTRISQSAYDNPTYKVEIQQETMGL
ncbi:putative epidermal cell surface receptor isoform X1 [Euwallacea similis]|uniref:putative epidermal cell surface receptor isoform X1 n=1 Tax=Euwallacea similis TaxID=1736056 RepID=UPI00344EBFE4